MRSPPLFLLFLPGTLLLFAGCCRSRCVVTVPAPAPYSRVVSSDHEGCPIAEYIAEGPVCETECGFRFRAVERRFFRPWLFCYRYPLGRPVTVAAPNVVATPTCKPEWLAIMEAEQAAAFGPPPPVVDTTVFR